MGAKWNRSKQWDDRFFPRWAWPAKVVLRAFSSIPLAVFLLTLVCVYGILASVPIGLLAKIPTKLFYGVTLVATIAIVAVLPLAIMRRVWKPAPTGGRGWRFAATCLGAVVLLFAAWEVWVLALWPRLQFDPATGGGVRFFSEFIERYQAVTLRRLPGVEMSELEFYAWWPLRLILLLFVVNMIVATVRRIEFVFPNLGVLTVHSGIVVIALGSAYYGGLKKEGDTLLLAGPPGDDGTPQVGPPQGNFYDNTRTVLWVKQPRVDRPGGFEFEQHAIRPPRYNEYNLDALGEQTAQKLMGRGNPPGLDRGRTLRQAIESGGSGSRIDDDVRFTLVGYVPYAELVEDWVQVDAAPGETPLPIRFARLESERDERGQKVAKPLGMRFFFTPTQAKDRLGETEVFGLEYTLGMPAERWDDLGVTIPTIEGRPGLHALVVEVPGVTTGRVVLGFDAVGQSFDVPGTGYRLTVKELHPQPPFPLVTPGYQGAQSSLVVVRVQAPAGPDGTRPPAFDRWVYHRYPEISQDLLDEKNERGMPRRRGADGSIRIGYVDASKLQVYLDESAADGSVRALVRTPGQPARVVDGIAPGGRIDSILPGLHLQLMERWAHAIKTESPIVVPEDQRERDNTGNHGKASICVEVSAPLEGGGTWSRRIWVPFSKYLGVDPNLIKGLTLPDGRKLELAFGRQVHPFPEFMLRLKSFEMIAYEHRGTPRDYQSLIEVIPTHAAGQRPTFERFEHITRLNAPLQAPFMWDDGRSWAANMAGTLASRLNPHQFKFSQAGWDPVTWERTQEMADRGEVPRPFASFTILGVGNNPGIHVIALGGVMMSIGIPWAFYVKPWIMQRRKRKLQEMLASSGGPRRRTSRTSETQAEHEPAAGGAMAVSTGDER